MPHAVCRLEVVGVKSHLNRVMDRGGFEFLNKPPSLYEEGSLMLDDGHWVLRAASISGAGRDRVAGPV